MLNIKQINATLTGLLILGIFSFPASAVAGEESSKLTISPPSQIVYQSDAGKSFTVNVQNAGSKEVTLLVTERRIARVEGKNVPIDDPVTKPALEISTTELKVAANSQVNFKVRVKLSLQLNGQFPAVYLEDKTPNTDTSKVSVNSGFYIPFIIEKENAVVDIYGDLEINNVSRFVFTPVLDVRGLVRNDGDTFFDPAGTITVSHNGARVYQQEVTSQVAGLMFPDETRNFNMDFAHDNNLIKSVGQYTVEAKFDATNAKGASLVRVTYYYVPINLILIAIGVLVVLILVISYLVRKYSRRRKLKKSRKALDAHLLDS